MIKVQSRDRDIRFHWRVAINLSSLLRSYSCLVFCLCSNLLDGNCRFRVMMVTVAGLILTSFYLQPTADCSDKMTGRPALSLGSGALSLEEKKFLLAVERGDVASTRR